MTELNTQDQIIELSDEQIESIEGGIALPPDADPVRKFIFTWIPPFNTLASA